MSEGTRGGGTPHVSVDRLAEEIASDGSRNDGGETTVTSLETVRQSVVEDLGQGSDFEFDQEFVKQSLEEILLVLISERTRETHGKELIEDLTRLFDSPLSPGTVYPRLHELDDEDVLESTELVRRKEYDIRDVTATREMLTYAVNQHLALGLLLARSLARL